MSFPDHRRATLAGCLAILLWAALAPLTASVKGIPPFEMLALTFAIGGLAGTVWLARRRAVVWAMLRQPPAVWALGVGGLFGYHFFYFVALARAPAADASLIAYLWPLLIVLFSGLLPGERLRPQHIAGACCGLAGVWLLVGTGAFDTAYLPGYLAAGACALTWSGYSVLNRRFGAVPTDIVALQCLAVALLGAGCHFIAEVTVWPSPTQWGAITLLGLGPVGLAFFVWDYGTKRGDLQLLGVASYAAPVLSTLLLLGLGLTPARWQIAAACTLIVGGAMLAALRFRNDKRTKL